MNKYYAVVDQIEDVSEGGKVVQRVKGQPFRDGLCILRLPPEVISGVITRPETCVVARPDKQGVYTLREADGHMEQKTVAMEMHKKRHPNIIGPFNSHEEARLKQEQLRPKTEMELLREENRRLKDASEKKTKKPAGDTAEGKE